MCQPNSRCRARVTCPPLARAVLRAGVCGVRLCKALAQTFESSHRADAGMARGGLLVGTATIGLSGATSRRR